MGKPWWCGYGHSVGLKVVNSWILGNTDALMHLHPLWSALSYLSRMLFFSESLLFFCSWSFDLLWGYSLFLTAVPNMISRIIWQSLYLSLYDLSVLLFEICPFYSIWSLFWLFFFLIYYFILHHNCLFYTLLTCQPALVYSRWDKKNCSISIATLIE